MRNRSLLFLAFLLFPIWTVAQGNVTVKGRIVNKRGEAVEYVQVGVPALHIGTISTADGHFEIEVPCGTLEFFHVSYQTASCPVTGPADDVVIVLEEQELPPAVSVGGDTREKYLIRPGKNVLGNGAQLDFHYPDVAAKGLELGSVAKVRKPFLVRNVRFSIASNYIPGCVASINIYRIDGKPETFVNVLHRPIYVEIAQAENPQDFDIQPEEMILLEPGKYYFAFQIVASDETAMQALPEAERSPWTMHLYTKLYLKSSYRRDAVFGEFKHV